MLAAAVLSALSLMQATSAADRREEQWISREVSGEGAVVSFLSWNYTSVITRAHCDDGRMVFQYFYDAPDSPTLAERPPTLIVDEVPYRLEPSTDRMSRRIYTLSPAGTVALSNADNVDLEAPNEMDEPWYLGKSAALVRLAGNCG